MAEAARFFCHGLHGLPEGFAAKARRSSGPELTIEAHKVSQRSGVERTRRAEGSEKPEPEMNDQSSVPKAKSRVKSEDFVIGAFDDFITAADKRVREGSASAFSDPSALRDLRVFVVKLRGRSPISKRRTGNRAARKQTTMPV